MKKLFSCIVLMCLMASAMVVAQEGQNGLQPMKGRISYSASISYGGMERIDRTYIGTSATDVMVEWLVQGTQIDATYHVFEHTAVGLSVAAINITQGGGYEVYAMGGICLKQSLGTIGKVQPYCKGDLLYGLALEPESYNNKTRLRFGVGIDILFGTHSALFVEVALTRFVNELKHEFYPHLPSMALGVRF